MALKDLAPIAKPPDTDGSFRHGAAWFEHPRMEVVQTAAWLENYRVRQNFTERVFTIACTHSKYRLISGVCVVIAEGKKKGTKLLRSVFKRGEAPYAEKALQINIGFGVHLGIKCFMLWIYRKLFKAYL